MKNYFTAPGLVLLLLAVASCHKDNDTQPSGKLTGKWSADSIVLLGYAGDQLVESDTEHIQPPDYLDLEFKSGNSFTINSSSQGSEEHQSGYYEIQGNTVLLGGTAEDPDKETYSYQLNGSKLTLHATYTDTVSNQPLREEDYLYFHKQ